MNPRKDRPLPLPSSLILITALALLGAALSGCASRTAPLQREAVRLYDEGQYAEAQELLERLDDSGSASGTLLYRLHYCQQANGDEEAPETLERAKDRLEEELPEATGLEVPFYLVNAYQNLARSGDGLDIAKTTTARIESGELPEPDDPIEMFRLGKLYADQNRTAEAKRWYAASVDGFSEDEESSGPYQRWASRYLADPAFRDGDYEAAARYYGLLAEGGDASAADLDRLAEAQFRLGLYMDAARSWAASARSEALSPNRPRYLSRLAMLAATAGELPTAAPDGRAWSAMSKDELSAFIVEQANVAKPLLAEGRAPESLPTEEFQALRATLGEAKALFAASAIEYALKRYGIREAAFFGGYAPLIFDKRRWRLVSGPKKEKTG